MDTATPTGATNGKELTPEEKKLQGITHRIQGLMAKRTTLGKQAHENCDKIESEHSTAKNQMVKETTVRVAEAAKLKEESVTKLRKSYEFGLKDLEDKLAAEIRAAKAAKLATEQQLRAGYDDARDELNRIHKTTVKPLEDRYESESASLKATRDAKIADQKKIFEGEAKKIEQEINDLQSQAKHIMAGNKEETAAPAPTQAA